MPGDGRRADQFEHDGARRLRGGKGGGQLEEAERLAAEAIATPGINAMTLGQAHGVLAAIALSCGAWSVAEEAAQRACAILGRIPTMRFHPRTVLLRSLLGQGRVAAAQEPPRSDLTNCLQDEST